MDKKRSALETLDSFKCLLQKWDDTPTSNIRGEINRKIHPVKQLIKKAGVSKSFTISPPPAIGGLIMRNVDPFTCIFDPPYGLSVVDIIIDSIDEAMGIIESDNSFFDEPQHENKQSFKKATTSNRIFIVHGRNNELKETAARFIEKLGLIPIILHEQTNKGKTIIEKFEDYSDVGFAIVLMTPDDIGYLLEDENNKKQRARQNVVFELGYFIGKLGRTKVAAIVKGNIEVPTDINGVVYIGVDNGETWKILLAKEIKGAGFDIDLNKLL
jgi:predicted nucleotide-binding protein